MKAELRERIWRSLETGGAARFPGAQGRIPNFDGARVAAERLLTTTPWKRAERIKCNPDAPQRKVRHEALRAGKVVYMAVPKLAADRPFIELDPARIRDPWQASSIKGAARHGRHLGLHEMPQLDLVVTGCVGAGRDGARLGKGGGYSDLEYAVLREAGRVGARTPIATTLHPLQLLEAGVVPVQPHDISLDWIALPGEVLRCTGRPRRPRGILWELLSEPQLDAMPALAERAPC